MVVKDRTIAVLIALAAATTSCAAGPDDTVPVASQRGPLVADVRAVPPQAMSTHASPLATRGLASVAATYAAGASDPETLVEALYCYVVTRTAMSFAGTLPPDETAALAIDLDVMRSAARDAGLSPQHRELAVVLTAAADSLRQDDPRAFTSDLTWCLETAENFLAMEARQ